MAGHSLMRIFGPSSTDSSTGVVDRKLQALPLLTYDLDKESVGVVQNLNPQKLPPVPNMCLCKINELGAELIPLRNLTRSSA